MDKSVEERIFGHIHERIVAHLVNRFLRWKLPENFSPDAGITFKPNYNEHTPWPAKHEPCGTNLLDASQAEEMVRYMLEGLGMAGASEKVPHTSDTSIKAAPKVKP